jgi:mRNA-degrading endonuclease YafQ of YafQ-DinJ toxin-antitoxin module
MSPGVRVKYSHRFLRSLSRLSQDIIDQAQEKERLFKFNPFDPRLRTHKLRGKEKDIWAFWVTFSYRIKFIFLPRGEVLFLDIGTHKIYR